MNFKDTFNVNERGARYSMQSCKNPACMSSRAKAGGKLFKCSGCKVFTYCCKDCQHAHWKEHKPQCLEIRKENDIVADYDQKYVQNGSLGLSPKQAMDEFRAFVDHFNPQISFAAVNAFREGTNLQPTGWEEDFFLIKVERRPNPSPLSPRWARFMISHAKRYSIEDFEAVWGAEYEKPGNARAADVKKAKSRGAGHGVITVWLTCFSSAATVQAPFPNFFSPQRAQAIGRMNTDPFVFLRDAVEKVSSGSSSNSSKPV